MPTDRIRKKMVETRPSTERLKEHKPNDSEEVVVINGERISKRIYNLCVNHYLSIQYGD